MGSHNVFQYMLTLKNAVFACVATKSIIKIPPDTHTKVLFSQNYVQKPPLSILISESTPFPLTREEILWNWHGFWFLALRVTFIFNKLFVHLNWFGWYRGHSADTGHQDVDGHWWKGKQAGSPKGLLPPWIPWCHQPGVVKGFPTVDIVLSDRTWLS